MAEKEKEKDKEKEKAGKKPPKKKKTGKKREKLNIPAGIAHILASVNNTVISITDLEGNLVANSSSGAVGFKGSREGNPFAAHQAAAPTARRAKEHGVRPLPIH